MDVDAAAWEGTAAEIETLSHAAKRVQVPMVKGRIEPPIALFVERFSSFSH
jgi:hypothetical protein